MDPPRRVSHLGICLNPEVHQLSYSPARLPASQFREPGTRGETERKEEIAREEMRETERWEETKGCTTMDRSV